MDHPDEHFNVVQFFPAESYEYIRRNVTISEAVNTTHSYIRRPAALIGIIQRLIITDSGDSTVFEWQFGKGITFPDTPITREWNRTTAVLKKEEETK